MYRLTTILITLCTFFFTVLAAPLRLNGILLIALTKGTWFETGTGACGYTDSDDDPIVAISAEIYGSGGNCNQWIHITNTDNGQTAYGKTRDECESCGSGSLDMSPGLFEELSTLDTGEIPISWHFMNKDWSP
ncbi:RlpA-like double-psi beta-barrel-protein domain-containing protein-containing protein [Suillus subaureus]|uniref:RlpA-like double-psi beta-barrel-protein domain-containing protein-containing protein n=1 Tax=Suillus subaureus TaxID=48587 RepID=A0A9P7JHC5_9AGAM|nr:RlpA-like double-psi beta-barrel-protein domain-containing protein-containing protein [Suillus subaureus]KAG1822569.1 RlpA-like double-psi beta-barrel-protein domain-containing protein-containing protein [Suillus subaureus]